MLIQEKTEDFRWVRKSFSILPSFFKLPQISLIHVELQLRPFEMLHVKKESQTPE